MPQDSEQIVPATLSTDSLEETNRYQIWRKQLISNRLRLGLGLILGSFIILTLLESFVISDSVEMPVFSIRVASLVSLLATWGIAMTRWGSRLPLILFGGASVSVTLLPQILATLMKQSVFNPHEWVLMFLMQGVCIPVLWPLHLGLQVVPIAYFAIAHWLVKLPLLQAYPQSLTEAYLGLWWISAICSFAVYGFERSLYGEFVAQQKIAELSEKLENQAMVDHLTKLPNRRRFEEYLAQEWRRMGREIKPLSLILIQVDALPEYIYTYGQQMGNDCLQQITTAIQQGVQRPADLVARYTTDSFIILLPYTDADGAMQVANKIRTQVNALKIFQANAPTRPYVTISIGVSSTIPQRYRLELSLVTSAEAALHQAKSQGGDRIILQSVNRE